MLAPFQSSWGAVHQRVEQALHDAGITFKWVGAESDVAGPFNDSIQEQLIVADLVVADISDVNMGTMYELGFAHALKTPTLLVLRDGNALPFDMMGSFVFVYDPANPDELAGFVRNWAQRNVAIMPAAS